jgi:predicted alpha/beta-fold hydrolase
MPLLEKTTYFPSWPYGNPHAATALPTLLRRVAMPGPERQRLELPDGDFLDLDCWWQEGDAGPGTVVLLHGLEGSASRQYMLGMARAFGRRGWHVAGVNYRGCSGEPNRLPVAYHSGATADLRAVLDHLDCPERPVRAMVGFSLGGNMLLKYLGEEPDRVLPSLKAAAAFSVPTDLAAGERQLRRRANRAYLRRFLRKLGVKVRQKARLFPEQIDLAPLDRVRWLYDFDDCYTAPWGGFAGADEYYRRCSSRQFLPRIRVPSLLVSAGNDPFLARECYPVEEARASRHFHLEIPDHGGHVGFRQAGGEYWSELRAVQFVTECLD